MTKRKSLLTLCMAFVMCLCMGFGFGGSMDTVYAEGETDTRQVISKINATSNINEIVDYGNSVIEPTFNIVDGAPAYFNNSGSGSWKKKNGSNWENYTNATFMEGTYIYNVQIRIDDKFGTTHVLDKNGINVSVDGETWVNSSETLIYDTYSFSLVTSVECEVVAPADAPLNFIKDNKWDIKELHLNQALTSFSVAGGATGGTAPYNFAKVSGPDWINVSADGTVSGTPTTVGTNADLVISVTDSASTPATKEITLKVDNTYLRPEDREVISVIRATSNIGENLGYGKALFTPEFNITEGVQAYFSSSMGNWFKKEGENLKKYTETTFTEGVFVYQTQIRVDDEFGRTHVLNKDGISVYIDDKLCVNNEKPDVYDTYSYIYSKITEYEIIKPTPVAITDELVPVTELEKAFNDAPQEPTFGGTLSRGTDYEVSYTVKPDSPGLLFSDKPLNAGVYVVTVTGKGLYENSFTKEFVITKAERDVPVGLLANPISCAEGVGEISGVTEIMEYRKVGDVGFIRCTSTKITGLSAGEYEIRYIEDENHFASDVAKVIIAINHNFGEEIAKQEPTCSSVGMQAHYYCSRCAKYFDTSKTEKTIEELIIPIDSNAHNFGDLVAKQPATCIAEGMEAHYKCVECAKYFDTSKTEKTIEELTIPIDSNAHNFGDLVAKQPATCIAEGMEAHYKCVACENYFDEHKNKTTEEALKLAISPYYGHNFGFWQEEVYATCKNPGRKGYKVCSICEKKYDASNREIIDFVIPVNPDGHELDDLIDEVPATCKDPGAKAHRDCRLCGKHCDPITKKEIADLTIPVTGDHTFGAWKDEVPSTTTEFGTKAHKDCTVCGKHFDSNGNEIADLRIAKIGTTKVTVNGGTGEDFYEIGSKATVVAAAPAEGKRFKHWQDANGNILSTNASYTFTVAENMSLTAVYEDINPTQNKAKQGLSGGQIAGIVVVSVLFVGMSGFAIYWFAIKKKTFVDLGMAIKNLFKKKKQ